MAILEKVSEMLHSGASLKGLLMETFNQFGGVSGLVSRFREKGLGGMVDGWLQGHDLGGLTGAQLTDVLGSDSIKKLAEKTGIGVDKVVDPLSRVIPTAIHHLSPGGKVPEGPVTEEQLPSVLARLKDVFKKSA